MRKQLAPPAKAWQGFLLAAAISAFATTTNIIFGEGGAAGSTFPTHKIDRIKYSRLYIISFILLAIGLALRAYQRSKERK